MAESDVDTAPVAVAGAAAPLADPLREAERVVNAATEAGLTVRATGGVGVALSCASANEPPLARRYVDIDFVARAKESRPLTKLMVAIGYQPQEEFNALHGQRRLFFLDVEHQREADIFLGSIEMCHRLDLTKRFNIREVTLTPADLLLSKLQVVNTNEKDYLDATAILTDHELTEDDEGISLSRLNEICANDWGWWRTATMVAERTHKFARALAQEPGGEPFAGTADRIRRLIAELEEAPKSRKWKMRARVGDRVRWHEDPEDVEH